MSTNIRIRPCVYTYLHTDALVAADPVLHLADSIDDPAQYATLTDCVLRQIEFSKDPRLAHARQIVLDIRRRKLYKCVDEVVLSEVDARIISGVC